MQTKANQYARMRLRAQIASKTLRNHFCVLFHSSFLFLSLSLAFDGLHNIALIVIFCSVEHHRSEIVWCSLQWILRFVLLFFSLCLFAFLSPVQLKLHLDQQTQAMIVSTTTLITIVFACPFDRIWLQLNDFSHFVTCWDYLVTAENSVCSHSSSNKKVKKSKHHSIR